MTKPILPTATQEIYELVLKKISELENECERLKYDVSMVNKKRFVDWELHNLHEIRRALEKLYISSK
ncbi:MAG: hypothetical protein R3331_05275 [Sulfurospirillaceae bacterium]|nr:hypothetical protein [Sulfurospirillaceae bacterium]